MAAIVVFGLATISAAACEPTVSGEVLFVGDFTAADSSPWVVDKVNAGGTGLLPTVNTIDGAGVGDTQYWEDRLSALDGDHERFEAVVFSLGINDAGPGTVTPGLEGRIGAIADAATDGVRPVLWATLNEATPDRGPGAVAFNAALRAAAESRPPLRVIEFGAELAAHPDYLEADGVHWTETGQRAFGSLVEAELDSLDLGLSASLAVQKSATHSAVLAGDPVGYQVTVTNTGQRPLSHVTVSDAHAPECTTSVPDLAVGGSYTVDCTHPTTASDVGTLQNTAIADSDQTEPVESNPVEVTVEPPVTGIAGTVSSSASGAPLPGAFVAVLRPSDFSVVAGTVANTSGEFTARTEAGSYVVYVVDPTGDHVSGFFGAPTLVTVTSGDTVDVEPVMVSNRGSITATVTETGTGAPVGGVWGLALSAAAGNTGATEAVVSADESGELTLSGLRAGRHFAGFIDPTGGHTVRFYPDTQNVPDATPVAVTAGGSTPVSVSLPVQTPAGTGSTITGELTEIGTGAPITDGRVLALRASDYRIVRAATTDPSGHYRLDVAQGAYKLAFLDGAGLHAMAWYDDLPYTGLASAVSVMAPGTADAALAPNTGTMVGTVVDDPSGAPVAGAWVIAIGPSGIAGGAVTGSDGSYTVSGLAPGTYRATFVDPNGGRTQEYYDDSPTYADAATVNVTANTTVTADAALARPQPNIVMILTDDQTLESMRAMPQVQSLLADDGTTFANSVSNFPLCCPARATLLTGQYAHNHHVVNNVAVTSSPSAPVGGFGALDHSNTLVTWLQAAGYETAHVGKYLNCYGNATDACRAGAPSVPPGWDDWFGLIDPYPANYGYFEFDVLDNGQVRHFGPGSDVYQTDVLADRAVSDIEQLSARGRPFFLNIWTQAPHAGGGSTAPNAFAPAPAPRHTSLFSDEPAPATPAVGEVDVSDKPAYIRCTFGLTPGAPPGPGCPSPPTSTWTAAGLAPTYRATLRSLQAVDELVGRVVSSLTAAGELEDTVIIYTSDNGFTFGEHRLSYRKVVPYEESVRVPLVVRGPGFPAGHVASQLVGNIDVAPTITELSGLDPGRLMDGRSFVPFAQDPAVGSERALLLEDWPTGSFVGIPPHYEAIRTSTDVYIEYSTGEREYYDLVDDPYQLVSRHADPATAARRAALATLIAQLKTCAGASCEVVGPP